MFDNSGGPGTPAVSEVKKKKSHCVEFVSGRVLVVAHGAAGMAPARSFVKSSPSSNSAPPLAKTVQVSKKKQHISVTGFDPQEHLYGLAICKCSSSIRGKRLKNR